MGLSRYAAAVMLERWKGLHHTGNMSHLMPSGQDFFTQLKRQLREMDQSKPAQ